MRAKTLMVWGLCWGMASSLAVAASTGWRELPGGRVRELPPPASGPVGFVRVSPAESGLTFTNHLSDPRAAANQIRLNGSGVALGDVNGDGTCDIYLCSLEGDNALFLNRGDGRFDPDTRSPAIACRGQDSTGAVLADLDGDGDLDLLVNGIGVGTLLFLNDGTGRFEERRDAGFFSRGGATSLALADVDGDGDLDVYVCVYRSQTIRSTGLTLLNVDGKRMVPPEQRNLLEITAEGRILEHGEPDILYLNLGGGQFAPVSWIRGAFLDEDGRPLTQVPFDWGLSAQFRDVNGDGKPDLYVCNDFHSPDRFWLNESTSAGVRFRAAPRLTLRHTSTFSMAVDFADFNRDGHDDFFVADMLGVRHERRLMQIAASEPYPYVPGVWTDCPQYDRNTLQLNRGDGTYAEVAWFAALAMTDWTWSAVALDVDLDGWEDLLCTTGHAFDTQDLDAEARIQAAGPWTQARMPQKLLMYPRYSQSNRAFRNVTKESAGALRFEDVSADWHFDLDSVSHGMAWGDLDGDGDLDVVVNNLNAPVDFYRNEARASRLAVRLRGEGGNAQGVGARITVLGGAVPRQEQEMIAGGRYVSGDAGERVFATGDAARVTVEVRWRSGLLSRLEDVPANAILEVVEQRAPPAASSPPSSGPVPWFTDVSDRLGHTNHTGSFDDFSRQPLLPTRLSALGPGVTWADLDADGRDELILPDGAGGRLTVFRFRPDGGVEKTREWPVVRDLTTALVLEGRLIVGQSSYRDGSAQGPAVGVVTSNSAAWSSLVEGGASSTGPLAMADVDGDGDLDLFVGGRVIPGRWPEPATSRLLRNQGGTLEVAQEFPHVGLVSSAVFSDLDGDGAPDLALAVEWGPPQLYRGTQGRLESWDPPLQWDRSAQSALRGRVPGQLSELTGRWMSVTTGDFDGDGRMDLVLGNWGENSPYAREDPGLFFGDLAQVGSVEVIEIMRDSWRRRDVPTRPLNVLGAAWPVLHERFPTFAAFNRATAEDVLGTNAVVTGPLRVRCSSSVILLNRGDHFVVRPLPAEAQWAPVFGLCVADFDGDGQEDLFLSQNFFGVDPYSARLDAGCGLVLRGDGHGAFTPLRTAESGVPVWGEGRGAAVADFDGDGRPDLCVAQVGAATRLLRNSGGRPGLRIRLQGPEGNPTAIGASCRVIARGEAGPRREVKAGAGYWSCDSAILVMATPHPAEFLEIRWPKGRISRHPVPVGATEVMEVGEP